MTEQLMHLCLCCQSLVRVQRWIIIDHTHFTQQQQIRVDLLLNQIPEPMLSKELIVNTKEEAKEGKHTACFHKHPKAVLDNTG